MVPRLSLSTLASVPAAVGRPAYDPASLSVGIVHLGLGAFHRAHQAMYTDEVTRSGDRWGIAGVSLRSPEARNRLAPQDGLYVAMEKSQHGVRHRVIGVLRDTLVLPADRARILELLGEPATHVVTLTVTEKGYCHLPATGLLDASHPDIVHDLAHPAEPVSTIGLLVAGLDARRSRGAPVSLVCCDNLPHNGATLRQIVLDFASARDGALARWIEGNVAFPSTMVDRIVPATTEQDVAAVEAACGVHDAAPVVFEPFRQWVIEDRFAGPRPRWEDAGAELVRDVAPYETMKLRLLNASHSALAYLGYLAGHDYIYQVVAEPHFARMMAALMSEISPTLSVPAGVDLAGYRAELVRRFGNPALPHRTWQIAMDGSQKLPQRLLAGVRDNLQAGRSVDLSALAVAGWMRYVSGRDEKGEAIDVRDPLAARLAQLWSANVGDASGAARALLGVKEIFGDDLGGKPAFADRVAAHLGRLLADGADATVRAVAAPAAAT